MILTNICTPYLSSKLLQARMQSLVITSRVCAVVAAFQVLLPGLPGGALEEPQAGVQSCSGSSSSRIVPCPGIHR
jgi:hypothetical protein